ncbi:hypothetical protein [Kribbella flavida]|uniref:hypothetical protein n=1 Tax=Kribbella flavida TaxID=182640 RepID=UPI0011D1BE05|nr:hypothetical protein [Kribbella flavida]
MATLWASPAGATPPKPPGDYELRCNPYSGVCIWVLRSAVDDPGKKTTAPAEPVRKKAKPTCQLNGAPQACTSQHGNWSNSQQCYMQRVTPPPPASDPIWQGRTDGSVWACVREQGYDEGRHLVTRFIWLPGEPDTVVVDPLTLVYRAVASMQLSKPQVRTAPGAGQVGLVNMPVWLWVEKSERTWGPITRQASVPGLTVAATAQVKAVNWSLGDGKTLRCEGAGTAYDKSFGIKDSPDCGHRYVKTSRQQADCRYTVSATAQWDIRWQSSSGDTGQISMTQQAATQLRIGEAVPVLVDPDAAEVAGAAGQGRSC